MKVKPTQNSGIPASAQESTKMTDILDGTTNTIRPSNTPRGETPFAKDTFESAPKESFRSTSGLKMETEVTDKTPRATASGLKAGASEVLMESFTARGEASGLKAQDAVDFHRAGKTGEEKKVVEDLNVKYTMFLED